MPVGLGSLWGMETVLVAIDEAGVARPVVEAVGGELVDVETGAPVDLERVVLRAMRVSAAA